MTEPLDRLADLLRTERQRLLARWRAQVRQMPSAQKLETPALNDHIPALIDELIEALESNAPPIFEVQNTGSAPWHGIQRAEDDFDIEEVVAEYNLLRSCIHELAEENSLNLQGRPVYVVNRVLDRAIALALSAYMTQRALEIQQRREGYLAFVAHDLRTPLNAIALAGRALEMNLTCDLSDESARMLKALQRNVQALENLVGKVLEENSNLRTETGVKLERRNIYLWPFVEGLIYDLRPIAGKATTTLRNVVPEELVVYADATLLKRVFQNLIANAIRHTPRGEITISAATLNSAGDVECSVTDNGEGVAPECLDGIFAPGVGDSAHEGGAGLGLAIVKMFTEAHGGTVDVESQVDAGSVFRFTIPAKEAGGA